MPSRYNKPSVCLLGHGYVAANKQSVMFRPFFSGVRIYIDHEPALSLPWGGYAASIDDAMETLRRYSPGCMPPRSLH